MNVMFRNKPSFLLTLVLSPWLPLHNLNPDASHCLVDMQNIIVDRHDFPIVSYVHNNRKYVGATRIYLGINRYWCKYIKYLNKLKNHFVEFHSVHQLNIYL